MLFGCTWWLVISVMGTCLNVLMGSLWVLYLVNCNWDLKISVLLHAVILSKCSKTGSEYTKFIHKINNFTIEKLIKCIKKHVLYFWCKSSLSLRNLIKEEDHIFQSWINFDLIPKQIFRIKPCVLDLMCINDQFPYPHQNLWWIYFGLWWKQFSRKIFRFIMHAQTIDFSKVKQWSFHMCVKSRPTELSRSITPGAYLKTPSIAAGVHTSIPPSYE